MRLLFPTGSGGVIRPKRHVSYCVSVLDVNVYIIAANRVKGFSMNAIMKRHVGKVLVSAGVSGALLLTGTLTNFAHAVPSSSPATASATATSAQANSPLDTCSSSMHSMDSSSPSMFQLNEAKTRDLTDLVVAKIDANEIANVASSSDLKTDEAKVYAVISDSGTYQSVTIPVRGAYSRLSNLTVLLDNESLVTQYAETLYSENEVGSFRVTSYVNGELAKTVDTDVAYMTYAQLQREIAGDSTVNTQGVWGTAACVAAVLGVSGSVGYLIVTTCTGACATPGVGSAVCIACIGAYAAVGGASIPAVASCFK